MALFEGGKLPSNVAKANQTIAAVAGGLTGIISFINTSTAKFAGQAGQTMSAKAIFAASQVLGPDITFALIGGQGKTSVQIPNGQTISYQSLPKQSINPMGAFNNTTYAGVALLIVEWALKEFVGNKYGLQYAYPWMTGIGAGLIFGGVLGGTFDPTGRGMSSGRPGGNAYATTFAGGPSGYASSNMVGVN